MMREFKFSTQYQGRQYSINIGFRGHRLVVGGDSATGKTFICTLANIANTENTDGYKSILIYNQFDTPSLKAMLGEDGFKCKDRLIIIDNAEILLEQVSQLARVINIDRSNFYLLFTRAAKGISVSPNYIGTVKFSEDTFSIEYLYPEGVWG